MLFSSVLTGLGLLGLASAAPSQAVKRQQSGALNVVYWGQNGGGTIENNDLSAYCTATSGIDVLVLAFLYQFGSNGNVASGIIGQSCFISNSGQPQQCDALTQAITKCQNNGVKIVLSLGGATGAYHLSSQAQAENIAQYLWDAYGNSGNAAVTRPLGANIINGFDFDIETNGGSSQYYQYMIAKLRALFATDPSREYWITGAPQCPIPEPNMSVVIENAQFDHLYVQFYNNNNYTVPCALGINGDAPFNYNNWTSYLQSTPSKNAKLFIGVPAAPDGANGSPSGAVYYASPDQLAAIVGEYRAKPNFGGVMEWSAGFSDSNVVNGCNYAQNVKSILLTGKPCAGFPISSNLPTPTAAPTPSSSSTPASTPSSPPATPTGGGSGSGSGTVPQWGQCGGAGYTGPTQCAAPYTCVSSSTWWSDCR
ncbi:Endochitinase [Escovopsis weberi]|uniref:chitinase n=1 Tax=Escovopsis weberi TaxID=150374 RepID=A0A0M8MRM7_ESCWE|nr:Endochitinase [Escovopsis weberi]